MLYLAPDLSSCGYNSEFGNAAKWTLLQSGYIYGVDGVFNAQSRFLSCRAADIRGNSYSRMHREKRVHLRRIYG